MKIHTMKSRTILLVFSICLSLCGNAKDYYVQKNGIAPNENKVNTKAIQELINKVSQEEDESFSLLVHMLPEA